MIAVPTLAAHPRLFCSRDDLDRFRATPTVPALIAAHQQLMTGADAARRGKDTRDFWRGKQDPSGLGWTRAHCDRAFNLAGAWLKTGQIKYRDALLKTLGAIDAFKTDQIGKEANSSDFWLSDGEEAACFAIAYDWLYDDLSDAERAELVEICRRRLLTKAAERVRPGGSWWFARQFSNWNAVCAGGLGLLCLAMQDDLPELTTPILEQVEASIDEFIRPLKTTDGGWPEGLGYWNYGMLFAFQYLLAWERSYGRKHALMKLAATRKTLEFPLDFFPNQSAAGFGDNNGYGPTVFQYAAARRFGLDTVVAAIDSYLDRTGAVLGGLMGGSTCFIAQHPGTLHPSVTAKPKNAKTATAKSSPPEPVSRVYKGLGWGMLADSMPQPRLYLAMRGGDTTAEHSHVDLLSVRVMVGDEWLIENGRSGEYLHPTFFSKHRPLINDINATYKNTVFINGVGPLPGTKTDREELVSAPGIQGLRMIASSAMVLKKCFCGRLALMLDADAILLIDRTESRGITRTESRLHTYRDVQIQKTGAVITGERESARVSYGSLEPAEFHQATTAPASPHDPSATMLRWSPRLLYTEAVLATLITPGRGKATVTVERDGRNFLISAAYGGGQRDIRVTPALKLAT